MNEPRTVVLTGRETQTELVLSHLRQWGTITAMEAVTVYKIMRLAARIEELRRAGHDIVSTRKIDGAGDRYVQYSLTN